MGSLFSQGRVAQRSNDDAGFSFNLPPQIIAEREKAWSSLFDKYADEASDDVELNIKTMKPATNKGSADKDEDEDAEHRQYYSKCRAPIRKLPALIQYWVDTGNPPYQLTGEEDHSDTGSSLSEGEYSRSRQSAVLRESIENPKVDEFSPYSSVDTAAYVLSNTNVTKKAQTQEIVEGAKRPNKQLSAEILSANENGTDVSVTVDGAPTAPNDAQTNNSLNSPQSQAPTNTPLSQGSSVMLSEVLPALQQFDELLEKSKQLKSPRSALSKVRRIRKPAVVVEKPNVAEPASNACDKERQKNSLDLSENSARKTVSLRKLYTGRNSPVDLIMARTSTESTVTTGPNSHPALEPENRSTSQVPLFISRARARRKRKRASIRQSAGIPTLQSNNSQESQELVLDDGNNNNNGEKKGNINEAKEGHERYTDFFESLGLTPSQTIIGKDEEIGGGPKPSAGRKIAKRIENKGNESQDPSSQNVATAPRTVADAANDGSEILGNKVLSVRIVRLPEECLYRYGQVKGQSPLTLPCALTDKKNLNIELLTTMTHDSDSSTILICSCNPSNNYQSSDSDCSLFTQSINRSASESHRGDRKSTFETSESALPDICSSESPRQISDKSKRNSTSFESIPKPLGVARKSSNARNLVVRLDKLANNGPLNVTKPANEIPRGSHQRISQVSSPVAKTVDAFDPAKPMGTETRCVTIGSRVFGESSRFEASKLKPAKPIRGSFDRSFGMCLDDDDDSFARLVQEFGSTQREFNKRSKKGLNDTGQGIIDAKMNGVLKVPEEKIPRTLTRSCRVTEIASSSDDKEDEVIKIDRASKRTLRKIDRKRTRDLPNRENERDEVTDEHVKNLTNNGEAIVGMKNRPKKSVGKLNCDKVPTESYETNDFGRSVRPKFVSVESTEPKNLPCKPKRVENVFGTRDEVRSKNSLDELTNAQTRSNSERQKISIPHDETNDDKPSRITRSARFHTLLNSDTDSHSENENSVITEQPLSGANQPLNRTNVFTEQISTDRKKTTVDKLRDLKRRRKNAVQNLDDPISEFVTAVPERNGESSRLLPPSCNFSSKDSSEDLNILHSRRKKKEEPRLKPISRRKGRRTRILGTPIESESDEDERKQLRKAQTNGALQPHEDVQTDERKVKCSPDTTANKDNSGREKRLKRSKHLFPYIFDDMIEDVDLIFSGNGDDQATMNDHMTKNSNLETPKICKNMINARESTRTFRTRLSCVSDDDNVS